jgi:transposase
VLYVIGNRSRDTVDRILTTGYSGIIHCDYYGVYQSFAKDSVGVSLQTCLSHLKREYKRCADHFTDQAISKFGEKMVALINALFDARKEFNKDPTPDNLEKLRQSAEDFNTDGANAPDRGRPETLAKRFKGQDHTYTTFVENPGVEPTNNAAERSIRPVVMARNVTQGTRGEKGRLAAERYWSIRATCERKSFSQFFKECYLAWLKNNLRPLFLINTSSSIFHS